MSVLDSFFNKGFKAAKCKTLLKLTIPRIRLLRNRREIQIKQMRRDIAKLLETGQEATARIRVEHIIREESMMAAQEILELFCELTAVRLPIIETQRECPLDLKEAISSICFAAPRCADLPELLQVQMLFATKYGKEFVSAAAELMPDCGVNRQLIELLSIRAPSSELKLKLLKEIAEEHELDWDPAATETEFSKAHEDLLNGPTQFVSGSKLPLPTEKHKTMSSSAEPASNEHPDAGAEFDPLDFPDVPKVLVKPSPVASAPAVTAPRSPASHSEETDSESSKHSGVSEYKLQESLMEPEDLFQERSVSDKDEKLNKLGGDEDKQFVPFTSPPAVASALFSARHGSSSPAPSRTTRDANVDLQDVIAAAEAAAETAERAAAAARSAASLAQVRIAELTKKRNDKVSDCTCENPFYTGSPEQSLTKEKPQFGQQNCLGDTNDVLRSLSPSEIHEGHQESESPNIPYIEKLKMSFDSPTLDEHFHDHDPADRQPQRSTSMDDDSYFSYPNLFTWQNSNLGSGSHHFTDNT
uniref:IST1-like protein n=1 Tax=Carica papaya TaxID=3649 RepID=B0FZD6_CARPA|nr:hypothetical protein [Carica papaya]